jgi:hypothetical protein
MRTARAKGDPVVKNSLRMFSSVIVDLVEFTDGLLCSSTPWHRLIDCRAICREKL